MAADALGYRGALLGAALVSAAGLAGTFLLPSHRPAPAAEGFPWALLVKGRFLALVGLAALPSRLLIGAFLYYLLPLHLHQGATAPGVIGLVAMVYALILATTATLWARLADRSGRPLLFTILGLLLSGGAMLAIPLGPPGVPAALVAVAGLGLAQAIGMAPQVTVLLRDAATEARRCGPTAVQSSHRA